MYFNILVSIVFGIPTVRREKQNYLIQTLVSLVKNMNQTEQDDSLIVVMIAEVIYIYIWLFNIKYVTNRLIFCIECVITLSGRFGIYATTFWRNQKSVIIWITKHLLLLNIILFQVIRCCELRPLGNNCSVPWILSRFKKSSPYVRWYWTPGPLEE